MIHTALLEHEFRNINSRFGKVEIAPKSAYVELCILKDGYLPQDAKMTDPVVFETRRYVHQVISSDLRDGDGNYIPCLTPEEAIYRWKCNFLPLVKARATCFWRVIPEISNEPNFAADTIEWRVYSRCAIADDLPQSAAA